MEQTIGIIGAIRIVLVLAYWLGTTQAETVTEIKKLEKIGRLK